MNFLNSVLIFTLEVFILCKKVREPRRWGARIGGMNFDIPWNFVKEHVLHYFMKYFFVGRVDEKVNKDLSSELSPVSNLPFSTP